MKHTIDCLLMSQMKQMANSKWHGNEFHAKYGLKLEQHRFCRQRETVQA